MISPQSGRQINSEVNNDQTISVIYFEVCPFYWDTPASVHTDTHTHSEFPESSVLIFQVTHTHTHTHPHTLPHTHTPNHTTTHTHTHTHTLYTHTHSRNTDTQHICWSLEAHENHKPKTQTLGQTNWHKKCVCVCVCV